MTISHPTHSRALSARASMAVEALKLSNWMSRALGRGSGTVAGGRVGLALDPELLTTLAAGRKVGLVSGTNGKTTTTRMLVAALSDGQSSAIATNDTGANMPAGHVSALVGSWDAATAVLEVDEGYLARVIQETLPRVVVLLNLSRDQLDRISEVRMVVERWRQAMGGLEALSARSGHDTVVVANADDPMVAWVASAAPEVRWVGAGQVWHNDAVGCPACGGRIIFEESGLWSCDRCEFARPRCEAWLEGPVLVMADGARHPVDIRLPGQFNRANAAMVAIAAPYLADGPEGGRTEDGGSVSSVLRRVAAVDQVAGRFSSAMWSGHPVRLLLAKNPAGWTAIFDLLDETGGHSAPVVLSINARIADGFDTSWLWDVPFERLAGRLVVATGDRRLDLAVRLRYGEVEYTVADDPLAALDLAAGLSKAAASPVDAEKLPDTAEKLPDTEEGRTPRSGGPIDFLGNYTAFADVRKLL